MAISATGTWCAFGGLNRNSPCGDIDMNYCSQCCRGTTFILINNANLHSAMVNLFGLSQDSIAWFAKTQ